jgi:hypothetical protein
MPNLLQIKRGAKASIPTLAAGELAFCTDTFELFGGTGSANKFLGGGAAAWPITVTGNIANTLLSAAGDVIYASAANTPARLAKGTAGQVLTMNAGATAPQWSTPASGGMTNPMTTAGDIIYGGASGAPTRLAKGTDGQILSLASGIPSWAWGGKIVQVVNYKTGAVATGTALIPFDDTIPQNTEGFEVMTLSITPKSASNLLLITAIGSFGSNVNNAAQLALFQDSTAGALAATYGAWVPAGAYTTTTLMHYMTAGTTSATTFKVRAGGVQAGTLTFNGNGGARIYGGIMASSITIIEIAA